MNGLTEEKLKMERKIAGLITGNKELTSFYEYMAVNDMPLTTVYNYLTKVKEFLTFVDRPVSELAFSDFSRYMLSKRSKENGEEYSAAYKRGIYYALKEFGEYLVTFSLLEENPMYKIKPTSRKESQKTIERRAKSFLTKEEIKESFNTIETSTPRRKKWISRDKVILEIFLCTGIRCSALYKLDISSINFENATLIVTDKGAKVKEFHLPIPLLDDIELWLEDRERMMDQKEDEALFISNRLTRLSKQEIAKIVKKYTNNSPHKLRATFASQLYEETRDFYLVQESMSHANPETTRLYIRGQEERAKDVAKTVHQMFF